MEPPRYSCIKAIEEKAACNHTEMGKQKLGFKTFSRRATRSEKAGPLYDWDD
jgi:hypothetical protein